VLGKPLHCSIVNFNTEILQKS